MKKSTVLLCALLALLLMLTSATTTILSIAGMPALPAADAGEQADEFVPANDDEPFVISNVYSVSPDGGISASNVTPLAYTASPYKTYQKSDAVFKWKIANYTSGSFNCTSMQGMNVGTTYIYTAKLCKVNDEDKAVVFYRTNAGTGASNVMTYYPSLSSNSATTCTSCGHANDMNVVTTNSVNYMYVATCKTGTAITRLKIDGTSLRLTGYFDLVKTNGNSISASSIRSIRHTGGNLYFLIKNGWDFYYCIISDTDAGGSASAPKAVTCYKLFTIDVRNVVIATSNSASSTVAQLDTWIRQGFTYNSEEGSIYVPMFDGNNKNIVLVYKVSDLVTAAKMSEARNNNKVIYPCTLSFAINSTESLFEVESVGFRTGQGDSGDKKMYFNTNCSSSAYEGIWQLNYQRGSYTLTSVENSSSIHFTVKYVANGGALRAKTSSDFYAPNMSDTRHIWGISAELKKNEFVRSGYTFIGWYLTRSSDGKSLYRTVAGENKWYTPGSQPAGAVPALYTDRQKVAKLSSSDGDVVTCTAQWKKNTGSTKQYCIRFNANGGTGTMADQYITYGTSTAIRSNTFTRAGYTFSGWIAYRMSDNSWIYKDANGNDKWIAVGASTTGCTLKVYKNASSVSKTSSVDQDIVIFFAVWTPNN